MAIVVNSVGVSVGTIVMSASSTGWLANIRAMD